MRFWTKNANYGEILKNFDENSIEKLNFSFIFILENLLLKLEPPEITPFSTTIFPVSGGLPSFLPLAMPLKISQLDFKLEVKNWVACSLLM